MKNTPESRLEIINRFFNEKILLHKDIVVFKSYLSKKELDILNSNFSNVCSWQGIDSENVNLINQTTKMHHITDSNIDQFLFQITNKILKTYSVLYPHTPFLIKSDQGYRYNLYQNNEGYFNHIDCSSMKQFYRERILSAVLQLNSDYQGGILHFPNQDFKIKLNAGDVILFPSIHTHPHSVSPVVKGERKNVVTWFI